MNESILVTGKLHPEAESLFKAEFGSRLRYLPDCDHHQLLEEVRSAVALITRSETKIDRQVIEVAQKLKVIARACVGVAGIDLNFATAKGILVFNTPGKNTNSAAELTMGLLLSSIRMISSAHQHVQDRKWQRHLFTGRELRGKRVGIVGLGNVGHRVALFCRGFEMEVCGFDPYISSRRFSKYHVKPVQSLEELARHSDIFTVHVPLNDETRGMVDSSILSQLPAGAVVLNAARGGIVDEGELYQCLESGHISSAGIDTWQEEPNILRKLSEHPRVVSTPHIGASTDEAQFAIGVTVFDQLCLALKGNVVDFPVNMPNVSVIQNQQVSVYASLAEKVGRLSAQLEFANPNQVRLFFQGDLAELDCSLLGLAWKKGYMSTFRDGFVSFVNADLKFLETGIGFEELSSPESGAFRAGFSCEIESKSGLVQTISGTVFDGRLERLTEINGYHFEIELGGILVYIENKDQPGVIGEIGAILAKHGINIDSFDLSRREKNSTALALIRIDEMISQLALDELNQLPSIYVARSLRL